MLSVTIDVYDSDDDPELPENDMEVIDLCGQLSHNDKLFIYKHTLRICNLPQAQI